MLTGAHVILYSRNAEADRTFLSAVMDLPSVDVGGGWLIYALPPSELAVHPAKRSGRHELYLMTDDLKALVAALRKKHVRCHRITRQRWGMLSTVRLPGGGELGIYEPAHSRPKPMRGRAVRKRATG